jgi:gluconolactonase
MPEKLYVSKPHTPAHGFTDGIEGPACDKAGTLYAVNFAKQGGIGAVTPSGDGALYLELPRPSIGNGIRFRRDGTMLIADYVGHNIYQMDPLTRKASVFAHDPTMNQPNDICITASGLVFASDPKWADNTGQIWRAGLDGKLVLASREMGTTNGIEISHDEKALYVDESIQRRIWVFDLSAGGELTNKRLLIEFPDHGLDGMRVDVEGNLYVTRYGKGTIAKLNPSGKVLLEVELHGSRPSNLCFGGPDGCTVYVTEVDYGRIEAFRVEKPGREWRLWQG